jgi:hypothetical protein
VEYKAALRIMKIRGRLRSPNERDRGWAHDFVVPARELPAGRATRHPYAFAALSHAAIQMILVALVLPEFGPIVDGLDGDATLVLALWETQWHLISLS